MPRRREADTSEGLNPYIALSDIVICLLLVVVFFVALGRLGLEDQQYRRAMEAFERAVQQSIPDDLRPMRETGRNDPPGVQRWVFTGRDLFVERSAGDVQLTAEGKRSLSEFAQLLSVYHSSWRRIRVEGHTLPPRDSNSDDWELSATRAAVVARQIQTSGNIRPYFLAVAGRAGQNPLTKVLVYFRPSDSTTRKTLLELNQRRIIVSAKNIERDPEAIAEYQKRGQPPLPALFMVTDRGEERQLGTNNSSLNQLAERFLKNDRVEVLVEYTKNASGEGKNSER